MGSIAVALDSSVRDAGRHLWGGCISRVGKDSSGGSSDAVAKETPGIGQ